METRVLYEQQQHTTDMKSDFSMASILTDLGKRKQEHEAELFNGAKQIKQAGLSRTKVTEDEDSQKIRIHLDDHELWANFHRLSNEMIVTKNGRYLLCFMWMVSTLF